MTLSEDPSHLPIYVLNYFNYYTTSWDTTGSDER